MSPPIHKDWWLAAALTSATVPVALAQTVAPANGAANALVTTVTQGASPAAASTTIYVDGTRDQRLVTGPKQTIHVLFSDQSAITLGPNSELKIAEYKFNTQTQDGNLLIDMTKGLLRVVGGFLSKKRDTVVRTSTATIGIRGGITLLENNGGTTTGTFLFGQHMSMSGADGQGGQSVTRPGFGLTGNSGGISGPSRTSPGDLSNQLGQFEQGNGTPPAPPPPGPAPAPSTQQVNIIDPNRVGPPPPGAPGGGGFQPTFKDLLGNLPPPPVS
jgi:hypothetical protein